MTDPILVKIRISPIDAAQVRSFRGNMKGPAATHLLSEDILKRSDVVLGVFEVDPPQEPKLVAVTLARSQPPEVFAVYVAPESRGMGICSRLFEYLAENREALSFGTEEIEVEFVSEAAHKAFLRTPKDVQTAFKVMGDYRVIDSYNY